MGWRFLQQAELSGDLPVPMECHILMLNTILLQLSDAIADTSMSQYHAHFQVLFTSIQFVADDATHSLASTVTEELTFRNEEEVVVICNGWTSGEKEIYKYIYIYF